jgi:hypothetical protein
VPPLRGEPADPRPASAIAPGLGTLVPSGHQAGDQGGLPGPPRHAQRRTQQPDTPRTRHLPPEQKPAPDSEKHRDAADELNRPSGLPGPRARERACAVLRGPRCSNAPGLPGMSSNRSPRVRARLRACCTVHSPLGCAVTPPRCIRRVPCSMNTSTYMRFSSTVSTCRKSTARIPAAWACRNCRHVGPERRGAGSMPAARRISHTVDGATAMPSFASFRRGSAGIPSRGNVELDISRVRALHLSGADEQRPRDAVVVAVGRTKILWLLRLDGEPFPGLCGPGGYVESGG